MFKDSAKINLFAQIQASLFQLEPNCDDDEIEKIISQIPKSYIEDKENLMTICRIFAVYSRSRPRKYRKNGIQLFEKIMDPIKMRLQNEPVFFWNLFGSLNYFKQWMYEEGLITIDVIVESAIYDNNVHVFEYFLPEIIEKKRELFENEFKSKIKTPHSEEYINELKELRKKYFNWIRYSNDVNDSIYSEIENNQLRLAIKRDDIDKFQSIISNTNISINSKIKESLIEYSFINDIEQSLLEFAIDWDSTKIVKYLLMNDAKLSSQCSFNSIYNGNYEIIHIIESKDKENFSENVLYSAIECWNMELSEYAIDNYDFDFIEKEDVDSKIFQKISKIFSLICTYMNFEFFEKIFLPFLNKNQNYVKEKIYSMLIQSFHDQSLFFTNEILKNPEIDINHKLNDGNDNKSILTIAVQVNNLYAVETILKNPKIDIEQQDSTKFQPFIIACACHAYTQILELFFKYPKFNIYCRDGLNNHTAFVYCVLKNNFCSLQCIINNFPDFKVEILDQLLNYTISQNYLTTFNLLIKYIKSRKNVVVINFQ